MLKYSYSLIRYIHDPVREETLNVGLLFYSPERKFIKFSSRKNLAEFKHIFPDFSARVLRQHLDGLEKSFNNFLKDRAAISFSNIHELTHQILPQDASSLQWAKGGSGSTDDLEAEFTDLSERFVQQEHAKNATHKTDGAVWKSFSTELKKRNLLSYFQPKTVHIDGFDEKYEHAYKNGKLHCLRPLSLDLGTEEGIRDKVIKEAGRYAVSANSDKDLELKFYFLLGKPSNPDFAKDFESAKTILGRSVADSVIFTEDEADQLPDYIEDNIKFHAADNRSKT